MIIEQMYSQIRAAYKSLAMNEQAIDDKIKLFEGLVIALPPKQAKKVLEEALKTIAITRSPSAGRDFSPPKGTEIQISQQVKQTAWELQSIATNLLKESSGRVHAETAVAVASGLAGALLLIKHHGNELPKLKPGSAILSEAVNIEGSTILEFLFDCEKEIGIKTDALKEIPSDHQPHLSHEQINIQFVPEAVAVCWRHELTPEQGPIAAILATVFLIDHIKTLLDPTIANTIAIRYIVFCSKTAPKMDL